MTRKDRSGVGRGIEPLEILRGKREIKNSTAEQAQKWRIPVKGIRHSATEIFAGMRRSDGDSGLPGRVAYAVTGISMPTGADDAGGSVRGSGKGRAIGVDRKTVTGDGAFDLRGAARGSNRASVRGGTGGGGRFCGLGAITGFAATGFFGPRMTVAYTDPAEAFNESGVATAPDVDRSDAASCPSLPTTA